MKNVLIPTDYTSQSLELICKTAEILDEPLNIYLFHAFDMPTGISELLFMKEKVYNAFITEELRQKCRKIASQYSNIRHIGFKRLHGNTIAIFNTFAEANNIDVIALPEEYIFKPVSHDSVNPIKMFKKSGIYIMNRFVYDKLEPVMKLSMRV